MANMEIREAAKRAGVKLWEVAEYCGVVDSTFSRHMRRELPSEKRQDIMKAIQEIAARREAK